MLFDILLYGYVIFFISIHTVLMAGAFMEYLRDKKAFRGGLKNAKVSVIISIHNESKRMEPLLKTLLEQDYQAQIIFIDDRSSDESPAMLLQFQRDAKTRGIDCIIISLKENPGPNHKQFALSRGISKASGDFFLFTDGDCEVPPNWVSSMAKRIQTENTGAVIGPVFKKKEGKGFFCLYQCYDHAIRYYYLTGAAGLGSAGGGFGNNLIISRKALVSAGGYDAIPPSPTEDAALISQIRKKGEYKVRAIALSDAVVMTTPEKSWVALIKQALRWNNGGLFSPEALTRFNYNLLMLIISAGILAIPLLAFFPKLWPMTAVVYIAMIENTIMTFALFRRKLPAGGLIVKFGYLLAYLFTPVYFTLMTLMGYAGIKPEWKTN